MPLICACFLLLGLVAGACGPGEKDGGTRPFLMYGDTRGEGDTLHQNHEQIVALMTADNPVAVFHLGDLLYHGTDPSLWDRYRTITAPLRNVVGNEYFPVVGNHELYTNEQQGLSNYFREFSHLQEQRWYSVERSGLHFCILYAPTEYSNQFSAYDSIKPGSTQFAWMTNQLADAAARNLIRVVLFHAPLYSSGPHGSTLWLQDILQAPFEQYGVSVVFSGHDHGYERSLVNGIQYVVSGGGGAPLHQFTNSNPARVVQASQYQYCRLTVVSSSSLQVTVINSQGEQIDSFSCQTPSAPQSGK